MKGLTLTQPWATLIALGAKRIETRPRQTHYRGSIAIHAAKGLAGLAELVGKPRPTEDDLWWFCQERDAFRDTLIAGGHVRPGHPPDDPVVETASLPRGVIVATARLVNCLPTERLLRLTGGIATASHPNEFEFGNYSPGRWAWVLTNVTALREPVPFGGKQWMFDVPDGALGA